MSEGLKGKVAIVTGAASGIGASSAKILGANGSQVVVADIDLEGASHVAEEIKAGGGDAIAIDFDLASEEAIERMVRVSCETYGTLDILVNNAAAIPLMKRDKNVHEADADVFQQTLGTNVGGTAMACKYALGVMREKNGGTIVNLASTAGLASDVTFPAYAASKAAIMSLTRWIATNYGREGVRCNAIAPGLILTPAARAVIPQAQLDMFLRHTPSPRLGEPDDVAGAVAFLASDQSAFVNGTVLVVDGGMTVHMPSWADATDDLKG